MSQRQTASKQEVARLDTSATRLAAAIEPQISLLRKTDKQQVKSSGQPRQVAEPLADQSNLLSASADQRRLRANSVNQSNQREMESETHSNVSSSPSRSASGCFPGEGIQSVEFSDDDGEGDETGDEDFAEDAGDDEECSMDSQSGQASGVSTTLQQTTRTAAGQHKRAPKPRRRVATMAQRRAANIRERRRMFNLNSAFDRLRKKVPSFAYEKRLSRIETLKLAIMYIKFMDDLVNDDAYVEKYKQLTANTSVAAASSGFLSPGAYLSLYGAVAQSHSAAAATSSPPVCQLNNSLGAARQGGAEKTTSDGRKLEAPASEQTKNQRGAYANQLASPHYNAASGNYEVGAKQLSLSPAAVYCPTLSPLRRSTAVPTSGGADHNEAPNNSPPTSPNGSLSSFGRQASSITFSEHRIATTTTTATPLSNLTAYASYQPIMSAATISQYESKFNISQASCCPSQRSKGRPPAPLYYSDSGSQQLVENKFIELACPVSQPISLPAHNQNSHQQQQYFSPPSSQQVLVSGNSMHYTSSTSTQHHSQHPEVIYHQETQSRGGYSLQSLEAR